MKKVAKEEAVKQEAFRAFLESINDEILAELAHLNNEILSELLHLNDKIYAELGYTMTMN